VRRQFKDPLFGQRFDVHIGGTCAAAYRKSRIKDEDPDEHEPYAAMDSYFTEDGRKVIFLWFEEGQTSMVNTVAHECYHALKGALEYRGVDDEETEAYYLGWLMEQIYVPEQ
jgi:hypothetical protein